MSVKGLCGGFLLRFVSLLHLKGVTLQNNTENIQKMKVIHTVKDLQEQLSAARNEGKTIGLVPTMGALHNGHASLVCRSVSENDVTVVSVFVNPTQFNDKSDLEKYPRTLDADVALLESIHADIVFAPSVAEMYPEEDTRVFSYPPTDTVMEGGFRPGHFNGVCQIVSKLFMAVEPTRAYFGEKDFQQIAVIRRMVEDCGFPIEMVACPIVREKDGLALSSRNALLSYQERNLAVNISRVLFISCDYAKNHSLSETRQWVVDTLNAIDGLEVQYYEIVDAKSLQSINEWNDAECIQGCITVFCGSIPVRLIDNVKYK